MNRKEREDLIAVALAGGALLGLAGAVAYQLLLGQRPPLDRLLITSEFGPRKGHQHNGVDLRAPEGTPIRAPFDGVVGHFGSPSKRSGYGLSLTSPDGRAVRLMHLAAYTAPEGEQVDAGDLLGLSGRSGVDREGRPLPPHIHLETLINGAHVDPVKAFPDWPWERV